MHFMAEGQYDPSDFRIIVVDDEKPVLELMADILEDRGWTVAPFESPLDALDRMKKGKYDALVLDLYMPDMPGMLLHAKLKVLDPELAKRTVFVTGHFSRDQLKRDLEESANLLMKPFMPQELVGAVSQILPEVPRQPPSCPHAG
jgi:CheY-like chemotaxis protein